MFGTLCLILFLLFSNSLALVNTKGGIKTSSLSKTQRSRSQAQNRNEEPPPAIQKFDIWLDKIGHGTGIFEYADLNGIRAFSLEGILFLATNIPFLIASQMLKNSNSNAPELLSLASSLDISFVCSFLYHYAQLYYGPRRKEVKRYLFIDYISAILTCTIVTMEIFPFFGQFHQAASQGTQIALAPLTSGCAAILALGLSWKYEGNGRGYILFHGMWHLLSAYTALLLGQR